MLFICDHLLILTQRKAFSFLWEVKDQGLTDKVPLMFHHTSFSEFDLFQGESQEKEGSLNIIALLKNSLESFCHFSSEVSF